MQLNFYGHACWSITHNEITLFFDPFITDNPANKTFKAEDLSANYILVSHAHSDHIGDTASIAKRCKSTVISTAEVCYKLAEDGCKTHAMHIGGKYSFEFGYVRVTPAFHGSGIAGGHACGFIVNFYGKTFYFAGDTSLFGDMKLLGELEQIDYAMLPIGSNYTMGPDDAVIAAKLLNAKTILPMHYNTWPVIDQDPELYKKEVLDKGYAKNVVILQSGDKLEV